MLAPALEALLALGIVEIQASLGGLDVIQAADGTLCADGRQRAKMEPHCLGKATDPGRSGGDNRTFIEAVLWMGRTGSPWRDLPFWFGKWNTIFKRYRDWSKPTFS